MCSAFKQVFESLTLSSGRSNLTTEISLQIACETSTTLSVNACAYSANSGWTSHCSATSVPTKSLH